jgi:photosystem II stability/assembly factor-like uncharacterized protein
MNKLLCFLFAFTLVSSSSNPQSGWQVMNSGITTDLNAICFTSDQTGYACGAGGIIIKTTNAGVNWSVLNSSVTYALNDICFADSPAGFCAGSSGVLKTTNAGANWFSVLNLSMNAITYTQNTVYSGGASGVYVSTNMGQNWTQISTAASVYCIFFNNKDTGQIMGYNGLQYKTTNAGIIWFMGGVWFPGTYTFNDCYFFNSGTGYCCCYYYSGSPNYTTSHMIFKCNQWASGSSSWLNIWSNPNLYLHGITFAGLDTGYIVGGGIVSSNYQSLILKTTNGGNNWSQNGYNFNQTLYDVVFINSKSGYVCGRNGIILKTETGGVTNVELISGEVPESILLSQNYPNPFNNETIISFIIPMSTPNPLQRGTLVTLKVYDLTGREVETLVNGNYSMGNYKVTFNGDKLSSGIYFYKLFIDNKATDIKKMILLK